jgi:hypothetical protein
MNRLSVDRCLFCSYTGSSYQLWELQLGCRAVGAVRGSGFGGTTLPVATFDLSLSASLPELSLSLLFIIKRLQLLVPLLLINPLFINHSLLEQGVLGVWGFGVMG